MANGASMACRSDLLKQEKPDPVVRSGLQGAGRDVPTFVIVRVGHVAQQIKPMIAHARQGVQVGQGGVLCDATPGDFARLCDGAVWLRPAMSGCVRHS